LKNTTPIAIHWFRRDFRLNDNAALYHALKSGYPVQPIFIFDEAILSKLQNRSDARVTFIMEEITKLKKSLNDFGADLLVYHGNPMEIWKQLLAEFTIQQVFTNEDYEPYATKRDQETAQLLATHGVRFNTFKDQVIFAKDEILKDDGTPYSIFTPYSKKWKAKLNASFLEPYPTEQHTDAYFKSNPTTLISLEQLQFQKSSIPFPLPKLSKSILENYTKNRDFPALNGTSNLSIHLRFGTISIRSLAQKALQFNETYLNELIWREFYQMILYKYPHVVNNSFKPAYDRIPWQNNEEEFAKWCNGQTGYPLVDAGMRELNTTGLMHNRVRMVTASFLIKHLLIDWRWGEAYFAEKLLDFELASNNGGWQWAASSGCDAAPYFRVFNPSLQMKRFDPNSQYIKKWVPELNTSAYPKPIVDHEFARKRVLTVYKNALS
jgi:deoxyribodipyrimidine photo-lyase